MSFSTGSKSQGKKQDTTHPKQNQSRGNKKWTANNNNSNGNNSNSSTNGNSGNTSNTATNGGRSHHTVNNNGIQQTSHLHSTAILEEPELVYHMHDRMLFLLGNLYGSKVQVTVRNGAKFEGVFQGATTEGDLGVSLALARKIHDPSATEKSTHQHPVLPSLLIFSKDLMEITAMDTDLTTGELSRHEKDSFKTDTDISGKGEIKERELHKWNPELPEGGVLESLEGDLEANNDGGSWDQFAANEKLFGLKTDFDEEIYTTRLDRSAPDFKDREKRAIEKANEIQRSTTNNPHMLEERNVLTSDDSGLDEEDRYGAVVRDANPNVYVPPALRKQYQPKVQQDTTNFSSLPPDSPLHKLTTGTLTTTASPRQEGTKSKKSSNEKQQPKRIESEIANTFRQFAMLEKDKLQAKRQALHKKEQSDRLADLVKFHQTFKLNVPVPPDLLPLLAKGKRSPTSSSASSEPGDKLSSNSSPESKTQETDTVTATSKSANSSKLTTTTASETNDKKSGFKFNIKASEFKPNPAATVFVPGGKVAGGSEDISTTTFAGRSLKKGSLHDPVTIDEIFKAPFSKGKYKKPSSVGPTWPYGSKQYRHQFSQYNQYSEDIFTGYPAPAYGYGYPQYRYHQQYVPGMSAIPVQQQNVSYMSPQFVPNVPITAATMHHGGYSPQMPNGSPHGSPFLQGFSSPQRSPMPPPPNGVPPPQVYQYQGNPSPGGSMPVRYTPDMMTPPSGTPVMMQQRPVMVEHNSPGTTHYPPPMTRTHDQIGSPSQTESSIDS